MNKDYTYCHGTMRCNQCETCSRYLLNATGQELWMTDPALDKDGNCRLYDKIEA